MRPENTPVGMKISARPKAYGGGPVRSAPMPKGDRPIVLYPAYFDLGRTRDEGRRVGKKWGVDEAAQPQRHLDEGRLVGFEDVQDNPLDVAQRRMTPRGCVDGDLR